MERKHVKFKKSLKHIAFSEHYDNKDKYFEALFNFNWLEFFLSPLQLSLMLLPRPPHTMSVLSISSKDINLRQRNY